MKKLFFTLFSACLLVTSASAQDVFLKGDKVLNLGIGIGNTLNSGSGYSMGVPALSASLEYGVADNLINGNNGSIGVGGYAGYASSNYKYFGGKTTVSNFVIGARGTFHYQFVDKLDTYTGLMLGYNAVSWSDGNFSSVSGSSIILSWYLGGRYYFTDKLAAMVEIGYDVAPLNLGIAYKF